MCLNVPPVAPDAGMEWFSCVSLEGFRKGLILLLDSCREEEFEFEFELKLGKNW